jgi:Fanconi anemia group M protein
MIIYIDRNECRTGVDRYLLKLGLTVHRLNLDVGDYVVNRRVGVERKTVADFKKSIIDGRLFRQVKLLKQNYADSIVIIEGTDLYNGGVNAKAIKGAIVSLSFRWKVPVIFTKDISETAEFLHIIAKQNKKYQQNYRLRFGKKPASKFGQRLYLLEGIPRLGPHLAKALLRHFGSIKDILQASEEELMKVRGIGKVKAREIKCVLGDSL